MGYLLDTMGGPKADAFRLSDSLAIYKNGGQIGVAGAVKFDGDIGSVNTAALLHGAGTSTTRVTSSTAGVNFMGYWVESSATSGDARGLYVRLYVSGVGGDGEALRAFTTVNSATSGGTHGAHISLSFGSSGSQSGLGVAMRGTLHIPSNSSWTSGTIAAVQAEIYSDGANSDTDGCTEVSFLRCVNDGHATGIGNVDDDAYLIVYSGGSTGSGNVVESSTTEANYAYSIRCKFNGTVMYLMAASAVG